MDAGRGNTETARISKTFNRRANKQDFIIFRNRGYFRNQRTKMHQINNSGYLNERKIAKGVTLLCMQRQTQGCLLTADEF